MNGNECIPQGWDIEQSMKPVFNLNFKTISKMSLLFGIQFLRLNSYFNMSTVPNISIVFKLFITISYCIVAIKA